MKYLGVNLTNHVQRIHAENWKTFLKEIKDLNKWRYILVFSGRLNTVKLSIFSKLIERFHAIHLKIPTIVLVDVHKIILEFIF